MSRWLRHHRYALLVALRRLLAQPFSTLANVLVISLSLVVPVIAASFSGLSPTHCAPDTGLAGTDPVSAYPYQHGTIKRPWQKKIRADSPDIVSVRLVSRQTALETLKENPAWNEALAALPDNPLPDALVVTLAQSEQFANLANALADRWKNMPEVESIQLDSEWVRRLEAILRFVRTGLGLLASAVAVVVLATIFQHCAHASTDATGRDRCGAFGRCNRSLRSSAISIPGCADRCIVQCGGYRAGWPGLVSIE